MGPSFARNINLTDGSEESFARAVELPSCGRACSARVKSEMSSLSAMNFIISFFNANFELLKLFISSISFCYGYSCR